MPEDIKPDEKSSRNSSRGERMVVSGMWLIALGMLLLAVYVAWRVRMTTTTATLSPEPASAQNLPTPTEPEQGSPADLPAFSVAFVLNAVPRLSLMHTNIPNRPREDVIEYTVTSGDSVFSIAQKFNITPETVLWANYDQLQDRPDMLSVDMILKIPPEDGVYYEWQEGDTMESVAAKFEASPEDITSYSGNKLDLTNPTVPAGTYVMVPGGHREFKSWIVPTIARGNAGVSKSLYGPGACSGSFDGAYGGGGFIWPTPNHVLSGNDFWSGHLGIDIAAGIGDPIVASDSGVIVFTGWATGGYGNMIMIDHGNGYQSLYAHLSAVGVSCGQSVNQGQYIGNAGSTGNSTGSHLHFEIRLWGQFVNPWYVLP